MGDLVAALQAAGEGLAAGTLDLEDLEAATADARELYERLVVLRHKAREARRTETAPTPVKEVPEAEPIRLDTRPPGTPPRQTSLIEAIEATEAPPAKEEQEAPRKKAPAAAKGKPQAPATLAEKLEKAAIGDLGKAITLQHKFWFVAELFNGDRAGFERSITTINAMPDRESALGFLQNEVLAKLAKEPDPEAIATFLDLVERRFG